MILGTFELVAGDADAGWHEAHWLAVDYKWRHGWRRFVVPVLILVGLYYVAHDAAIYSTGAGLVFSVAALAPFAVAFVVSLLARDGLSAGVFWALYAFQVAIFLAELPFAHAEAFVMCEYIAILSVFRLGARSVAIIVAIVLGALFLPPAVHSWQEGVTTGIDNSTVVVIPILAVSVFAGRMLQESRVAFAAAQATIARLAAENERSRIARDLHDLLGHSLTTITVKAGLARRLSEHYPERAAEEIAEVEALARRSLADVRAAVSNYRDVTLAGELATGHELLRAAGIAAELPSAVDVVGTAHQELFGWAVREGLTNVVRHARASTCAVRLSPSSVEIIDDGVGGNDTPGNGLSGLRERVASFGGALDAGPLHPRGWRLRVSLAPEAGN